MLGHIQLRDFEPDLVTYNAAMTVFEKGQSQKALKVFGMVLDHSLEPNEITCNSLLTSCSNGQSWQAALTLFYRMQGMAMETNIISFGMVLLASSAGRKPMVALRTLESLQRQYMLALRSLSPVQPAA